MEPEYFQIRVLHLFRDQAKILNKQNQRLLVYPPDDFKPYLTEISKKYKGDCTIIIAELLNQADKHLTTFTEIQYTSATGNIRNMLVETHIFIFHRIKDDKEYRFVPNKEIL